MSSKRRIGLLASVTSQPTSPSPAIDLYRSPDFLAARKRVEASCQRWFVLSPKHGLVAPEDWIEPYQQSLADASESERSEWSERILAQLEERLGAPLKGIEVELHAGPEFYEHGLLVGLQDAGAKVLIGSEPAESGPAVAEAASNGAGTRKTRASKQKAAAPEAEIEQPAIALPPAPRISPAKLKRERQEVLDEFYALLDEQAEGIGGHWSLPDCSGDDYWPDQGVVFFFEPGETRSDGETPRVVRVATHALTATSKAKLWDRLRADRGTIGGSNPGSGNHRTSAFRRLVGRALIGRDGYPEAAATWGSMTGLTPATKEGELDLEIEVSARLAEMTFVWMAVPEVEDRIAIERGAVALLSNLDREPVDPPSSEWLGLYGGDVVAGAGLWNQEHTDQLPEMGLLSLLRKNLE